MFAIEGEDFDLADRIFVPLVVSRPDSYVSDRYLAALQQVPRAELPRFPMLAFGLGLALMSNPLRWDEAPEVFQIATNAQVTRAYIEPRVDAFSLTAMQAISMRLAGHHQAAAKAAVPLARAVSELPRDLVTEFSDHLGTVLRQLSYTLMLGGRFTDAIDAVRRAVTMHSEPSARNYSAVYGAYFAAFAGDHAQSRVFLDAVDAEAWPPDASRTHMNLPGLAAAAERRLDSLDFHGALETLAGLERELQTSEIWPTMTLLTMTARVGTGHARGEVERIDAALHATMPPPGIGDNVPTWRLQGVLAQAWINVGNLRAAHRVLASHREDVPMLAAARVALLLASGRDGDAMTSVVASLATHRHTSRTMSEVRTLGAVAALRTGDEERADEWLNAVALEWQRGGPRGHLALVAPRDRRVLHEFARRSGVRIVNEFLHAPALDTLASVRPDVALTPRELVVLQALSESGSIREIAATLVVSPHTVKSQLRSIYQKLGVSSRQAALIAAEELGLLPSADSGH